MRLVNHQLPAAQDLPLAQLINPINDLLANVILNQVSSQSSQFQTLRPIPSYTGIASSNLSLSQT